MSRSVNSAVIQIADYAAPYSGNFIASLLALDIALKKAGFRQVLVFPDKANNKAWFAELCKKGLPIYLLPEASPVYLAKKIEEIALRENAVILHTHFTAFDVAAWLAGILMKRKRKSLNIVWHAHSNFPVKRTILRKVKDLLKLQLMGRSVTVISVSEEIRQSLFARGFADPGYVVSNGIDLGRATEVRTCRADMRGELAIPDNALLLLSFGWEPVTKGIDLLLTAAERLSAEMQFVVLLIGTARLREFIAERYGEILPDWLRVSDPRECVADLFCSADVFISASRWEGFSYAVAEALANGLPVVSSNLAALEWARDARGILFFDSGNTDSLLQAMRTVTKLSTGELDSIKKSNCEFVEKRVHVDTWAQRMCSIYEEIIDSAQVSLEKQDIVRS